MRLDLTVNILTYHAVCKGGLTVFGGDQYRPNLSIKDMVKVYVDLLDLDSAKIAGRTFNLNDKNYTVNEIAKQVSEILDDNQIKINRIPTNDNRSYRLCSKRAESEIGFNPEFPIEDSIREVASALRWNIIKDPDHIRYRNVEWLKAINFRGFLSNGQSSNL